MYLVPLEPPAGMIPLTDPFTEFFTTTSAALTNDLFFSGHTATLFLLYLLSEKKFLKILLLFSTFLIAAAVLVQHVHYTIDVLAAPFFSYAVFKLVLYNNKIQSMRKRKMNQS